MNQLSLMKFATTYVTSRRSSQGRTGFEGPWWYYEFKGPTDAFDKGRKPEGRCGGGSRRPGPAGKRHLDYMTSPTLDLVSFLYVYVCACVHVRACVCVRACVRAYVCACVRAWVRVHMRVHVLSSTTPNPDSANVEGLTFKHLSPKKEIARKLTVRDLPGNLRVKSQPQVLLEES
ncbi:hypothetical protein EVAR_87662_1 [Eumeta japonica]|uniref:Uncharacterized protein n=1 Tax=Eumeta variegata TaxID=151549 RepID=A0A4C1WLT4_EUMVA|nr:hypothetical protein EVAR_87662_1 [Eumeta japonica]